MQQIEIEKERLLQMQEPLLAWFEANMRRLPWREEPTPYHVWVSEIMLQQTRVEAVKGYYARFLDKLPEIRDLAQAGEDELLKLWEGLGYYNRVRNMQKTARTAMEKYGGQLPADYDILLTLSGIGSYTAGAVASIAYGIPVPAVDGNVLRVITRICADETDITKQSFKKEMEEILKEIIPSDRPGVFNQALMELGAIVCVPNGPARCGECPVMPYCEACRLGRTEEFPVKSPKKARVIEKKTVFLVRDGAYTALTKRSAGGLLAGLYEFPNVEGYLNEKEAIDYLREQGFDSMRIEKLSEAKHIFSHREWHMRGYLVRIAEQQEISAKKELPRNAGLHERYVFATIEEMEKVYPVPSAFAAYKKLLCDLHKINKKKKN